MTSDFAEITAAEVVEGDDGPDAAPELWIRAVALSLDGALSVRRSGSGPATDPVGVGRALAAEMVADGAHELLDTHAPEEARP